MSDLGVTRRLSRNEPFPPFRDASLQRPIWEDSSSAPISGKKLSSYVAYTHMYTDMLRAPLDVDKTSHRAVRVTHPTGRDREISRISTRS